MTKSCQSYFGNISYSFPENIGYTTLFIYCRLLIGIFQANFQILFSDFILYFKNIRI